MSLRDHLRFVHLSHLSGPPKDRPIHRAIYRHEVHRIVELGIGLGERALKMIRLAGIKNASRPIGYTGIDLFEARSRCDSPGLTMKAAYRKLVATGARIRLVPGDPFAALSRVANELMKTDLVVVSAGLPPESLAKAWFFLPRMLHADSHVFLEEPGGRKGQTTLRSMSSAEIAHLAAPGGLRRAA